MVLVKWGDVVQMTHVLLNGVRMFFYRLSCMLSSRLLINSWLLYHVLPFRINLLLLTIVDSKVLWSAVGFWSPHVETKISPFLPPLLVVCCLCVSGFRFFFVQLWAMTSASPRCALRTSDRPSCSTDRYAPLETTPSRTGVTCHIPGTWSVIMLYMICYDVYMRGGVYYCIPGTFYTRARRIFVGFSKELT